MAPRAFSLVELLVVLAVAVSLMSLLMPALQHVRENTHRIICSSNEKQLGQGIFAYGTDHGDRLPYSAVLHSENANPQNLMATRGSDISINPVGWDSLGLLYFSDYCGAAACYYCPSHHGHHPYERYEPHWQHTSVGTATIFANYHYCGDIDWTDGTRRSLHTGGYGLVLVTDGLRTSLDFNHLTGMNVLRGDGSVRWRDDVEAIVDNLPAEHEAPGPDYSKLWSAEVETQ
jgi:prepilin-type N-terminal cleavage/methylation domain-containing protein